MKWHIDAWDAMGGRAFASQRDRNVDLADYRAAWGPTVYIGPPSFRPEQIANIAIALSARRSGVFDPRVPRNDEVSELEFPSADAVAEFVRRAFLGGGRTRGGEGGVPAIEGGGPGEPPEGQDGEAMLEYYLREWTTGVMQLDTQEDMSAYFLGRTVERVFAVTPGYQKPLVDDGAMQVLATLLAGFPGSAQSANVEQWQPAAATLNVALTELGIWQSWFQHGEQQQRANCYLQPQIRNLARGNLPDDGMPVLAAQQILTWPFVEADNFPTLAEQLKEALYYVSRYRPFFPAMFQGMQNMQVADKYEALFTWPIPYYARIDAATHSVGHLLSSFVSEPGAFTRDQPGALEIVAFAAALLASRTEDRRSPGWREQAAATWLAGSVPRWIFRMEAEALIRKPEQQAEIALAGATL